MYYTYEYIHTSANSEISPKTDNTTSMASGSPSSVQKLDAKNDGLMSLMVGFLVQLLVQ